MFRLRTPITLVAVSGAGRGQLPIAGRTAGSGATAHPGRQLARRLPIGSYNSGGAFGSGPVYGFGGPTSSTDWGVYNHNKAYAETKIAGPILVRARDLFRNTPVIFVGQYAAGPTVGSDTVDGQTYEQHVELLFDTSRSSKKATEHKFDWPFIAGVPNSWSGSTGWQIDGIGFSEVFLAC